MGEKKGNAWNFSEKNISEVMNLQSSFKWRIGDLHEDWCYVGLTDTKLTLDT